MIGKKEYKIAVVGCGRSGSLFDLDDKNKRMRSHSGAYKTHKKIELIGICDSDENKLLNSSKFWKIDNTYSNYKEMITENEIEILSICTLPDSHFEITEFAARNGVKVFFVKNPLAIHLGRLGE